jgi:Reverse transcriptase (RNA-dependent DNA polymerase)
MDVVTAFLNSELNEEIVVEQPEGFGVEDSSKVCKLGKSVYGLMQAPRQWHAKIDGFLVGVLGFSRIVSDECFYVRIQGGIIASIALYVDDLLMACNNIGILNEIKEGLSREFEMKDMGQARMCLGFRIFWNRLERKLTLSQQKYALSVLSRFGMSDANRARTPMEVSIDVDDSSELATNVPYRETIGSLMYLMVGTRPDITFAVSLVWLSILTRRQSCNGKQSSTLCGTSNTLRIMDWNLVDQEMLISSVFAIQTGVVTQRLENRHPDKSSARQVVLFYGVRRNKPWLPSLSSTES